MSSIPTHKLEQLIKQRDELNKIIKDEEEDLRKFEELDEINKLEVLVKPLTNYLNQQDRSTRSGNNFRSRLKEQYKESKKVIYMDGVERLPDQVLNNEEIFVILISILKNQDERIKQLEVGGDN